MREYTDTYTGSVISEAIRDADRGGQHYWKNFTLYIIFPNSVGSFYIPSN